MKKETFNYQKLRGRIIEIYGSQTAYCKENHVNESYFSQKLTNKRYFDQEEILVHCKNLNIPHTQISDYFFTV